MALPKGTKRYQHLITNEVRYFRNAPNLEFWTKVGTPGSKDWRWVSNLTEEKFIHKDDPIPDGWELGRIRA
jgi:hypothetical protein